jgi:AcrR family transcriptional regulator
MSMTVRRREQRDRRSQVREQIVAAATEALRGAPYRELTIDEVMRTTGLSRTLFYRHFDDLADLLIQVTTDAWTELYEANRKLEQTGLDDAALIPVALEPSVRTFERHGPLLRALSEAAGHDERIERAHDGMRRRYVALLERYLRRLRAHGATAIADPAETALALILLNERYLTVTFGVTARTTPEAALRTLTEIWTATIAQPEGSP